MSLTSILIIAGIVLIAIDIIIVIIYICFFSYPIMFGLVPDVLLIPGVLGLMLVTIAIGYPEVIRIYEGIKGML